MKKYMICFSVAFAAIFAHAQYLWWTVNGDDADYKSTIGNYLNELKTGGKIDGYEDVYANIVAVNNGSERVGEYSYGFTSEWGTGSEAMSVSMSDLLGSNVGSASSYSYYVEILTSKTFTDAGGKETNYVGKNSDATSYTDLASQGSVTSDLTPVESTSIWHGGGVGGYAAAPEPTSAVLLLLGVAGLALRRKQRKQE